MTSHIRVDEDQRYRSFLATQFLARGQGLQKCRQDDAAFSFASVQVEPLCLQQNTAEAHD